MNTVKVGIIGCGNISDVYLKSCKTFDVLQVVACADIVEERAAAKGREYGVEALSVEALLAAPDIQIVVNLTIPEAHAAVALASLRAGKNVHGEKPLAISREDAQAMVAQAKENGLLLGCAPDTFLGGGLQTCRKLIGDGKIGEPVAASVFMMYHGPESFHPDPAFLYQAGAGPLFDMGPYYLTALITMIGPIKRVSGMSRITFPERTITSEPKRGETIKVKTPTHIASLLEFHNGAIATMVTSFDVWEPYNPQMELHGTRASLRVPDANFFGGAVQLRDGGDEMWADVPLSHGYTDNYRGIGVADMAYALLSGRAHRANAGVGFHVLDVMHSILTASREGRHVDIQSTCERPAPLPVGLPPGALDE